LTPGSRQILITIGSMTITATIVVTPGASRPAPVRAAEELRSM
jgi:hypothetical protein